MVYVKAGALLVCYTNWRIVHILRERCFNRKPRCDGIERILCHAAQQCRKEANFRDAERPYSLQIAPKALLTSWLCGISGINECALVCVRCVRNLYKPLPPDVQVCAHV